MRLLCDEMLGRLARWLRAAGYDTALPEPGTADRALVARAVAENRTIISRDRKLAEFRAARGRLVRLPEDGLEAAVAALSAALAIDWLHRPLSRCLRCNAPLVPVTPDPAIPEGRALRRLPPPHTRCPACGKLYWAGGHRRRMLARLAAWQRAYHRPPRPAPSRAGDPGGRPASSRGKSGTAALGGRAIEGGPVAANGPAWQPNVKGSVSRR